MSKETYKSRKEIVGVLKTNETEFSKLAVSKQVIIYEFTQICPDAVFEVFTDGTSRPFSYIHDDTVLQLAEDAELTDI